MNDHERLCSVMFDEMKIKSGLVFSKNTGTIIGFTELGGISDEMEALERSLTTKSKERQLATHVLSVVVRGLFKHFNIPIGFYASKSAEAEHLFAIIWEAVGILEASNLNAVSFVCDGASANRKFFEMHRLEDGSNVSPDGVVYWAWNRCAMDRKIYFSSDVPHLMKTLRNNLENSGSNKKSRNLVVSLLLSILYFF